MQIGTDIIEIDRIEKAMQNPRFLIKYFTENEINLLNTKKNKAAALTAAANFCGKEAVVKALGCGFGLVQLIDIEILRDDFGAPFIVLHNEAISAAKKKNIKEIKISLSHSKDNAIAMVVAY